MAYIALTKEPIDILDLNQRLVDAQYGGIVTFVGTVREWTDDIQTQSISYSAYETMAEKELKRLADEVEATGSRVVLVHRLGHLELTEAAVFVGVASAHRATAFKQCAYLMDTIKEHVPIWKEEFDTDRTRWGGIADDKN
ncbi:molybdopterin biosynthesis protein, E chain [Agrilactobacillus composti DSM 18527 = JCM 14202]|uniref:Molybdopterin biosynthesis protein, E chain n=1 Tax=Agrilactobacillus composti DSM 18527 = JCM 14202 TaxID=1423734 RepID=X0PD14_9LACO|nr:molybdenum cofactor biosynthesis protein MoaE [Agrilactobacillus composti]KRM33070.1 molybdopterin biosynthesis protein, E chain [Agrilactobacillus composti DSM 18527 = JCM 14202]GAF38583.1 molybdenum cofactor biosynthesis protein MoaE [Agrilactobacillus composti DSM 18527 = JCM 14202]